MNFGAHFVTGVPRNYSEFSDATVDRLYSEQSRTLDVAKRKEIVLDMQRKMFDLLPNAPIVWQLAQFGVWNEVKDLKAGIGMYNNLKFQNVWMAQ